VRPRPRDVQLGPPDAGGSGGNENPSALRAAAGVALLALACGAGWARLSAEPAADPVSSAPLAHIVTRLAAQDARTARDWADLSAETVAWGGRVQSASQPVPEGPVRDALASVDAGSAIDAHAADWPKLRTQLEALLQKPPAQPQPQPQPQKQQPQNQQQRQDQQKSQQNQSQQQRQQNGSSPSKDQQQNQSRQSAFGGMDQPPPSPDNTQKVGGTGDRQHPEAGSSDPSVAASLEKLDQIRGQDSPAELFQMIENNEPHPKNAHPSKDW